CRRQRPLGDALAPVRWQRDARDRRPRQGAYAGGDRSRVGPGRGGHRDAAGRERAARLWHPAGSARSETLGPPRLRGQRPAAHAPRPLTKALTAGASPARAPGASRVLARTPASGPSATTCRPAALRSTRRRTLPPAPRRPLPPPWPP